MGDNLRMPSDPHLMRWMLFVDGENFTIRAQRFAEKHGLALEEGPYYKQDIFVWFPGTKATAALTNTENVSHRVRPHAIRAHYYISVQGDVQKQRGVRQALSDLGFDAKVFKKSADQKHSKGVDIALAADLLANAFRDNYDLAVLIAGDGDFVPVVEEVKRLGKVVYGGFFAEEGDGLSPALRLAWDGTFNAGEAFKERWSKTATTGAEDAP